MIGGTTVEQGIYTGCVFFFNDTATTEIYTLSLHDALPILTIVSKRRRSMRSPSSQRPVWTGEVWMTVLRGATSQWKRSEEHTSELQSRQYLVCRLLLEKKKISLSPSLST